MLGQLARLSLGALRTTVGTFAATTPQNGRVCIGGSINYFNRKTWIREIHTTSKLLDESEDEKKDSVPSPSESSGGYSTDDNAYMTTGEGEEEATEDVDFMEGEVPVTSKDITGDHRDALEQQLDRVALNEDDPEIADPHGWVFETPEWKEANVAAKLFALKWIYGIPNPREKDIALINEKLLQNTLDYLIPSQLHKMPKFYYEAKLAEVDPYLNLVAVEERPAESSFYTGKSHFFETLLNIEGRIAKMDKAYEELPEEEKQEALKKVDHGYYRLLPEHQKRPLKWKRRDEMGLAVGGDLKIPEYNHLIDRLDTMYQHLCFQQKDHEVFMRPFLRVGSSGDAADFGEEKPKGQYPREPKLNEDGVSATGRGRRKDAVAMCTIRPGSGLIFVNKKPLPEYFSRSLHRKNVVEAFDITGTLKDFDLEVEVTGGGPTGQAQAIRHGIARAMQKYDPIVYRPLVRKSNLITVDNRQVEAKKPGRKKARKKFTWVKR
eukprot:Clim_evm73s201 gene=Clim_evmTU73s201